MKDIAQLKFSDINNDTFVFYRAKSIRTTKENLIPITAYLNDFSRGIIAKYGNNIDESPYVFPILEEVNIAAEQHRKIQSFTRSISQHLKKLCVAIGLPEEVSTGWARHSYATGGVRQGKTMEFMSEALGHKDIKTTLNYFAGFEDETKKEFAKNLMSF